MDERQTVLITGATSGIGYEFSKLFHERGEDLVLVARNRDRLEELKKQWSSNGRSVHVIQQDLSLPDSAKKVFSLCGEMHVTVDVLVNNAGFGLFGEHVHLSDAEVEQMLMLNITSLTLLCRYFGEQMKQRGRGAILNIASTAAYQPVPGFAAYAASKSFVLHFSEALSKELEDHGVTVSCLSPGNTDTAFFNRAGIGNTSEGFFSMKTRHSAADTARYGIELLQRGKLSGIPGLKNRLLVWSNRFAPRNMVASISKNLVWKT